MRTARAFIKGLGQVEVFADVAAARALVEQQAKTRPEAVRVSGITYLLREANGARDDVAMMLQLQRRCLREMILFEAGNIHDLSPNPRAGGIEEQDVNLILAARFLATLTECLSASDDSLIVRAVRITIDADVGFTDLAPFNQA